MVNINNLQIKFIIIITIIAIAVLFLIYFLFVWLKNKAELEISWSEINSLIFLVLFICIIFGWFFDWLFTTHFIPFSTTATGSDIVDADIHIVDIIDILGISQNDLM